jgi:hypothetical protein
MACDSHLLRHTGFHSLQAHGITNTPLTPYLDQELLYNNSLSVDGSKIESTGYVDNFSCTHFLPHSFARRG